MVWKLGLNIILITCVKQRKPFSSRSGNVNHKGYCPLYFRFQFDFELHILIFGNSKNRGGGGIFSQLTAFDVLWSVQKRDVLNYF